ncbi:glycosyltransferase family 4 protein [Cyclobacterium amurskyense]|uniref:glycosyltransferase family 4 protein n=1 Tax=Cyclobacterium amurskyense TaxID=320787 RepID=UPI0030D89C01|tara:strand:- start:800 stop:1924 length:1125 start_codon:yes stop_codon:yes gene_type:complete
MKKLLFTISSLENSGGSERSLIYRVNYLIEEFDYDITIVTTDKGATSSFYKIHPKIKVVNIPVLLKKSTVWNTVKSIFHNTHVQEKELKEFIIKNRFDICSSLGSMNFLYKSNLDHPFIKIKESRFTYKRFFPDKIFNVPKLVWRLVRLASSIHVLRQMDYVISLTEEDGGFWRMFHKKVHIMPNFINFNGISSSNLQSKVVIAVGRLEKEKDFASLIKSFQLVSKNHNNWKLEIYGEGSLNRGLNDLIISLNLTENVFLKGAVSNIFEKFQNSSIYVHSSFYEGFGNSILEAMAHGLPIVAFKSVGGVKILIDDSINGFLVENRNVHLLAEKINLLIEDVELRKEMGINSRIKADNYSEEKIMLQWHQFYSSI